MVMMAMVNELYLHVVVNKLCVFLKMVPICVLHLAMSQIFDNHLPSKVAG